MSDAIAAPDGTTASTAVPTQPSGDGSLLSSLGTPDAVQPPPSAPPAAAEPAKPSGTWRDKLPETLRNVPSLTKFDSEEALAQSYVNLEKMLGQDKIPVPRDENDTEAWERLYKAAGRPDSPDAYKIERPKDLPEGLTIDEDGEQFLKTFAHKNGWNQRQLDAAYKAFYEREAKMRHAVIKSRQSAFEDAMRDLQREGNAEETLTLARATTQQYLDQDTIAELKQAGLDNSPRLIRALARIGKDLTGHQVLKGRGGETLKSMEQWQKEANEFRSQHMKALTESDHPDHKMRVAELEAMYKRMYPETAA